MWMGREARSLQHQARLWQEVMAKILRERRGSNQGWRRLPIDKPGLFSTGGQRRRPRTRRPPPLLPSPALQTASRCPFVVKLKLNLLVCQDCEEYSLDFRRAQKKIWLLCK